MRNFDPLISNCRAEKSGLPPMAAMSGVSRSLTSAVTTAPNAPPMTTATARSITLPRSRNCRRPFTMRLSLRHLRPPDGRVNENSRGEAEGRADGGADGLPLQQVRRGVPDDLGNLDDGLNLRALGQPAGRAVPGQRRRD